ncbi:uncharacterized protein LOC106155992 [Lingula anatina]|uniref:Uncharacterized protein LOC106155992 n=1 Tax=Lingula anatina TaxID=7574 RepID=A0A1S3HLZ0_LINAN|nr:uncharacterized protein LOC106155992 [Lingula anatina]|eukprot:XP_013386501.1 uncharacterized protein LOC106155992 [Lingula anatina]
MPPKKWFLKRKANKRKEQVPIEKSQEERDETVATSSQQSPGSAGSESITHVPLHVQESNTDTDVSDTGPQIKKRKEKVSSNFTVAEEDAMIEWLKEHPELYNKKMSQYKDQRRKESLWREQGNRMGKDSEILKIWYKSIRTRYGKLMKKQSGQADQELTDRDRWVISNLQFLQIHIERVHRRTLVNLKSPAVSMNSASAAVNQAPSDDVADNPTDPDDPYASDARDPTPPSSYSGLNPPPRPPRGQLSTRKKRRGEEDDQLLTSLQDQGTHLISMQQQLLEHLKPQGDQERLGFADFVRSTLMTFNHECWRRCQKDMTQLLWRYIDENDAASRLQRLPFASNPIHPIPTPATTPCYPAPPPALGLSGQTATQTLWQHPPNQWQTNPENPTYVWGSAESRWPQQGLPQFHASCLPQKRPWTTPSVPSVCSTPPSLHLSCVSLPRDLDTENQQAAYQSNPAKANEGGGGKWLYQ